MYGLFGPSQCKSVYFTAVETISIRGVFVLGSLIVYTE